MKHRPIIAAMLSALFFAQLIPYSAWAGEMCSKSSPTHSAALLELYSSEGCSSCPPADKLLSQLATGSDANLLVPLALHVDYWDYLGWQDRFASSQFTARQRTLSAATHSNTIYTPEFFLNGQEFRGSMSELRDAVAWINQQPAKASIKLNQEPILADKLPLTVTTSSSQAGTVYVALTEQGLVSKVKAGENGGATLHHDAVARDWLTAFSFPANKSMTSKVTLTIPTDAVVANLTVVGFIQDQSGTVLQSIRLPVCH